MMKSKFSVHVDVITAHCMRINFSQPLCPITKIKFGELQRYQGVTVYNRNVETTGSILIVFTPVWDYRDVVKEIINLLTTEGFDKERILLTGDSGLKQ